MKKYLQVIPIIIYPYLLIPVLFIATLIDSKIKVFNYIINLYFIIIVIYTIILLISKLKEMSAKEMVKVNFIIKMCQMPWFIFSFVLEFIGIIMGIFGVFITVIFAFMNIFVRIITGIYSVGCIIKLKQEKVIGIPKTIFYSISSFVLIIDFIISILMKFDVKGKEKEEEINITNIE